MVAVPGLDRGRRVLAATPLRIKLVATVLLLSAIGLATAAVATTASLHGYLLHQVDDQLTAAARPITTGAVGHDPLRGDGGPGFGHGDGGRPGVPSQFYVVTFLPDGQQAGTTYNDLLSAQSPPRLPVLTTARAAALSGRPFTVSSADGHSSWRVITRTRPDGTGSIVIASSLRDVGRTVNHVTVLEVAICLVVLVLLGLAGHLLIQRSLRPLGSVETTAAAIAAGDLSRRVPELPPRTEVGRLSRALNGMLSQIETAFAAERRSQQRSRASEERMRRFVGDASHELRTPLTSIRGFAELYRMGAVESGEDLARAMQRIESEASRMGLLVDDLLLLARLDQQRPLAREPVDLTAVVSDAANDARTLAPEREIRLTVPAGPLLVTGDDSRLRQVVHNLVTNALVHTPAATGVDIGLTPDPGGRAAVIEVADRGTGIDERDRARIFERFFRSDSSRSRQAGGSGLGLSIVAALVAAHGGTVGVQERDGGGTVFTVQLPLAAT